MIRTIIFDLSEVLIAGLIGIEKELAPLTGLPEDEFLEGMWTDSFWDLMKGKISEDEYLSDVFSINGWKENRNTFKKVIRNNFHREEDAVIELLRGLGKKYELYLLSDHAKEWVDYLNKIHPFLELFRKRYFSCYTGEIKREKRAFELLLKENKLDASECLFIDDSPANILAAEEVGLNAVQYKNIADLKEKICGYINI